MSICSSVFAYITMYNIFIHSIDGAYWENLVLTTVKQNLVKQAESDNGIEPITSQVEQTSIEQNKISLEENISDIPNEPINATSSESTHQQSSSPKPPESDSIAIGMVVILYL